MKLPPLAMPWASHSRAYCLPGSLILKMALGEEPESIPCGADIRRGHLAAAESLGFGVLDRVVKHYAGGMRVSRVHSAAANLNRPGSRHIGFSDREHLFGMSRTFRLDVPIGTSIAPLADSLNQVSFIESAMPNYVSVTPFAVEQHTISSEDWLPWQLVRGDEALAYEPGDPGVVVGVVDSGVSEEHPELRNRLRGGIDTVQLGQSELALGLELLGDRSGVDTHPIDRFVGHGMGCCGIICAIGLQMPPGLAGEARILPMRALGAARFPGKQQPVGLGAISDLDMAVKLAVDLGAKVINMSFGTDDASLDPMLPKPHADVIDYALDRGCILVAASGNNGEETRYWPAAFPGVIAVGSVNGDGRPSSFSTRGSHVALCAPGERIFTLGLEGYQYATGTSFAAPFACAAAALLVSRAQRRSYPLDGLQVRTLFTQSATSFPGMSSVVGCGAGVLDAYAALKALDTQIDQSLPKNAGTDDW